MAYPTDLDNLTNPTISDKLNNPDHATQHANTNEAIEAIEAKVGTGASTPTSDTFLIGNGTGTSAWSALTSAQLRARLSDETGTGSAVFANTPALVTPDIGVATGTSLALGGGTALATTNRTGTGNLVLATSPTITTPTIADLTNATHTHANTAGGGTLGSSAITGIDKSITTTDSNPYKFRAYRTAAFTTAAASTAIIPYDTETFDTNNNFDITTNKGRYTVPVTGFYAVYARIGASAGRTIISLLKNGASNASGSDLEYAAAAKGSVFADLVSLTAGDYIEIQAYTLSAVALEVGSVTSYFSAFLVCRT